ncbi:extracellular solute-binding protein [Paenibacillus sp. 1P07SE]|uniref:extracellular solute-binding protein n=1 Tax=Paenibacillus sp. 1P07SE TaxID=3132209 RepID=UPI0039A56FC7
MSIKRTLATTAAAGLLAVAAAACSSANTPSPSTGTPDNQTDAKLPITASIYDRGSVPSEAGTVENNFWTDWINDNGPAQASFVAIPRGEAVQKFNVLLASKSAPDLIFEFDGAFRGQLYDTKAILPVDELIETHSTVYKELIEQYPALLKVATKEDGKMYEFGRVSRTGADMSMFIRMDWLEELGLEVPTTAEELFEVALAFTKDDPDRNGQQDTFGMDMSSLIDMMFQNVTWVVEDGRLVKDWDRLQAAVEFKKRLYDAGIVDKDFLTDKNGEKAKQDWINGKVGIYAGRVHHVNQLIPYESFRKNNPEGRIEVIALPASSFGQFSPNLNNPVQMTAVINAGAKHPEAVMKYVDFMASESTMMTMKYGFEGEHYEMGDNGCPVQLDPEKFQKEVSWNLDFSMLFSSILLGDCGVQKGQLNPQVALEKEFIELVEQADALYMDASRPMANLTHPEHMPALPQDLRQISTAVTEAITEQTNKAIIAGASFTTEQAIAAAKEIWTQSGGTQLEEFHANWYEANKDTAFLAKDMLEFIQ